MDSQGKNYNDYARDLSTSLRKGSFENIVGKGENAGHQYMSPFCTMFSTLSMLTFRILATLN